MPEGPEVARERLAQDRQGQHIHLVTGAGGVDDVAGHHRVEHRPAEAHAMMTVASTTALEAMAYSTADVLGAMEADSGVKPVELRVDGGAALNDWLMAFQAGVLGLPVRRPGMVETTALGAAGLAGLATGVWRSGADFLGTLGEASVFSPEMTEGGRATAMAGWRRALGAVHAWSSWREP